MQFGSEYYKQGECTSCRSRNRHLYYTQKRYFLAHNVVYCTVRNHISMKLEACIANAELLLCNKPNSRSCSYLDQRSQKPLLGVVKMSSEMLPYDVARNCLCWNYLCAVEFQVYVQEMERAIVDWKKWALLYFSLIAKYLFVNQLQDTKPPKFNAVDSPL